jgi:hypothetical protein
MVICWLAARRELELGFDHQTSHQNDLFSKHYEVVLPDLDYPARERAKYTMSARAKE